MTPGHVLEIAAGTGVVTRELIGALPELCHDYRYRISASPCSTVLNSTSASGGSRLMRSLPFDNSSFDAIVCQFGVMFFADKQAAFREALRVPRPGGRFLFEVWDRREEIVIQ